MEELAGDKSSFGTAMKNIWWEKSKVSIRMNKRLRAHEL
jgi:hypothetical protein